MNPKKTEKNISQSSRNKNSQLLGKNLSISPKNPYSSLDKANESHLNLEYLKKNKSIISQKNKKIIPRLEIPENDMRLSLIRNYIVHQLGHISPLIIISKDTATRTAYVHSIIKKRIKLYPQTTVASAATIDVDVMSHLTNSYNICCLEVPYLVEKTSVLEVAKLKAYVSSLKFNGNQILISVYRDFFHKLDFAKDRRFFGIKLRILKNRKIYGKRIYSPQRAYFPIEKITSVVAKEFDLKESVFFKEKLDQKSSLPRQIAMYIALQFTTLTKSAIGLYFKRTNHTTVIHAEKKISKLISNNMEYAKIINNIIKKF